MAVRIRLTRVGATKRPSYRVVAIDRRRARDGRALEILGFYDPLTDPATVNLDTEKIRAWIGKGAQPSDTVVKLMRQAENAAKPPPRAATPAASRAATATAPRAVTSAARSKAAPRKPRASTAAAAEPTQAPVAAEPVAEPAVSEEAPSEPAKDEA